MKRLTYKNQDGTWGMNNGYDMHKVPSELYGALWKLKDYEETELSPEEILEYKELGITLEKLKEIDKLYTEKCTEVNCLETELREYKKVLPLKVGDTVLSVNEYFGILIYTIEDAKIGVRTFYNASSEKQVDGESLDEILFCLSDIGKTVFLTQEEAEQAFKEDENEHE